MTSQDLRTIVITGGTGGIGLQSALTLARTGARVVITGRNTERGEAAKKRIIDETANDLVELVIGDVSSIKAVDALAGTLLKQFERIDAWHSRHVVTCDSSVSVDWNWTHFLRRGDRGWVMRALRRPHFVCEQGNGRHM